MPENREALPDHSTADDPMTTETARMFFERALKAEAEVKRLQEYIGVLPYPSDVADLRSEVTWLRNQMGDVRGMQTDGATPEEMDEALGRALSGQRARLAFDESRRAADEEKVT